MFLSVHGVGFLLGVQHALEADHVAAVSGIASGKKDARAISREAHIGALPMP